MRERVKKGSKMRIISGTILAMALAALSAHGATVGVSKDEYLDRVEAAVAVCPPALPDVAAFDSRIASDAAQASKDGFAWKDAAAFPLESKVCGTTATPYGRIPADMMDKVPPGVKGMAGHSTGHYFLLETDSPKFGVRWKCAQTSATDPYIPPQGMYGVDIYMREGAGWRFLKNGRLGGGRRTIDPR